MGRNYAPEPHSRKEQGEYEYLKTICKTAVVVAESEGEMSLGSEEGPDIGAYRDEFRDLSQCREGTDDRHELEGRALGSSLICSVCPNACFETLFWKQSRNLLRTNPLRERDSMFIEIGRKSGGCSVIESMSRKGYKSTCCAGIMAH